MKQDSLVLIVVAFLLLMRDLSLRISYNIILSSLFVGKYALIVRLYVRNKDSYAVITEQNPNL